MAGLNFLKAKKGYRIDDFLTIGTQKQRIRKRGESHDRRLDEEEARVLEANILRTEWHGEKPGFRSNAELLTSYLNAAPRLENTKQLHNRILNAMEAIGGDVPSSAVDQDFVDDIAAKMLRPGATPATEWRNVVTAINSVMQ